jgi:hypothetical protein
MLMAGTASRSHRRRPERWLALPSRLAQAVTPALKSRIEDLALVVNSTPEMAPFRYRAERRLDPPPSIVMIEPVV